MTKGYIYSMYAGADPGYGWIMNDPIFGKKPTLGACMPNIRRQVDIGDYIFTISGRVVTAQQYIIGGFKVKEKIDHLAAYERFPDFRLETAPNGKQVLGNIIVDEDGKHHPLDDHSGFEKRIQNYLIGEKSITIETPKGIEIARQKTLPLLTDLFGKPGNRVYDILGRGARKMDEAQIDRLIQWVEDINQRTK